MKAGQLRTRGTIENQDNSGNVPNGSRTWSTYASNVWAGVKPVSGMESVDQGTKKTQSDVTHMIKMRFIKGLKPTMRFVFDGRILMFRIIRNIEERDRELEIEAREETDV